MRYCPVLLFPLILFTNTVRADLQFERDVYIAGQDGYHTYRIPAMVVSTEGTVLAFCEGRKNGQGDQGDIDLLLKRSEDGGLTWSDQQIVYEEGGTAEITIGNPCPIVNRETGRIHLLFTRNNRHLFQVTSDDDGVTWTEPEALTSILDTFNYPWIRVATGPVHGIQREDGTLVAPLWLSSVEVQAIYDDPSVRSYRAGVILSRDGGSTWEAGGLVSGLSEKLNECTVVERADGTLVLNIREFGGGSRVISTSSDGGHTWSDPVRDHSLPCPTCQASMIGMDDGTLLFLNPAVRNTRGYDPKSRRNLTLRQSHDGGVSWNTLSVITPGPAGYSDLAIRADGTILCLFESGSEGYMEKISLVGLTPKKDGR